VIGASVFYDEKVVPVYTYIYIYMACPTVATGCSDEASQTPLMTSSVCL